MNYNGGLKEQVRGALANQPARTVTILSSLLAIEDEIGYIPTEAIEEVATFTSSTVNDVWGVASFYTNFRFTPPNEHVVEVCWGPTCHLLGAMELLQSVLQSPWPLRGRGHAGRQGVPEVQHLPGRVLPGPRGAH